MSPKAIKSTIERMCVIPWVNRSGNSTPMVTEIICISVIMIVAIIRIASWLNLDDAMATSKNV